MPDYIPKRKLVDALKEIIELGHYPDATIARRALGMPTTPREEALDNPVTNTI